MENKSVADKTCVSQNPISLKPHKSNTVSLCSSYYKRPPLDSYACLQTYAKQDSIGRGKDVLSVNSNIVLLRRRQLFYARELPGNTLVQRIPVPVFSIPIPVLRHSSLGTPVPVPIMSMSGTRFQV